MNSKTARRAFVEAEAITGLAHQIRVLRKQRGLTQAQFAKLMGTTQAGVSRLEDPSYGKYNIRTLIDAANVFDVSLAVRFESIVDAFERSRSVSVNDLKVPTFEDDVGTVCFCEKRIQLIKSGEDYLVGANLNQALHYASAGTNEFFNLTFKAQEVSEAYHG